MADTLEPVMNRHRLVIDPRVIEKDYRSIQRYDADVRRSKSLIYQMSRLTRDKGCLRHDDRLDALSMAVAYWTDSMAKDADLGIQQARDAAVDKELERAYAHFGLGSASPDSHWGSRW